MSRRGVPDRQIWPEMDQSVFSYMEDLKNAFDPRDFSSLDPIASPSSDAETKLNQIIAILKG